MLTYTVFAGVNGVGKTSIYKSIYYNENKNEKRINTDEMVAKIGSWKDNNLQIKCAREAVKLIKKYIKAGKSSIKNIKLAKENGFYIVMNYIGVDNSEIAKERVKIRVKNGGHGISDKDIERRYYDSLHNLKEVINICDELNIFDNTKRFREVAYFKNGILKWKDSNIPVWLIDILY